LALVGSSNLPYDYYVFLRCALTVTGVFVIVHSIRSHRLAWLGVGIPTVILWAPAVFIPLPTSVWKILDVIIAITFVVAGLVLPGPDGPREDGSPRSQWWKITLVVFGIGWLLSVITVYASGVGPNDCVQQSDTRALWCE
jgi:cytosine/uracil/thiamine/allantoin permease